jgi:hypothetical protein
MATAAQLIGFGNVSERPVAGVAGRLWSDSNTIWRDSGLAWETYLAKSNLNQTFNASQIGYDNSVTGLSASSVQDAIDELFASTGAAGSDTQVMFNDGGDLSGDSGLTYNKTTKALTITGVLILGSGPTTVSDAAGKILSAALNTVAVGQGGTGITSYTAGDLLYATGAATLAKLAAGTNGHVLTMVAGAPAWAAGGGGGSGTVATGAANRLAFYPSAGTTVDDADGSTFAYVGDTPAFPSGETPALGVFKNGSTQMTLRTSSDTGTTCAELMINRSRGTLTSPTAVQSGDRLGMIRFGGYSSTTWQSYYTVIQVEATENWSSAGGNLGAKFLFRAPANGDGANTKDLMSLSADSTTSALWSSFSDLTISAGDNNRNITFLTTGTGYWAFNCPSYGPLFRMQRGGTTKMFFGVSGATDNLVTGSAQDDGVVRLDAKAFLVSTDNGTSISFQVVASSGGIKTSAPGGGSAGAWKLGQAASVSPTAPNRTIRVDVDGVTLFLHAKTTND